MKKDRRIALRQITDALLEAELAKLRRHQTACDEVRGRIDGLKDAVKRQHQIIAADLETPVSGPVLDRWGGWVDRKRHMLNAQLAHETMSLEVQRQTALKAFGRAEALRQIAKKESDAARQKSRRKGA